MVTEQHFKILHLYDKPLVNYIASPQDRLPYWVWERADYCSEKKRNLFCNIGKLLHSPKGSILSLHNRLQWRGDANTLSKPEWSGIITSRSCHRPGRSKKVHCQTLSELHNDVVPQAFIATVKRAFASVNIKKWRERNTDLLRDKHAVRRLAGVIEYKDWTKQDFEGVMFSDECMVEKSRDLRGIWVCRTSEEKWYKDCTDGATKGPGIELMV